MKTKLIPKYDTVGQYICTIEPDTTILELEEFIQNTKDHKIAKIIIHDSLSDKIYTYIIENVSPDVEIKIGTLDEINSVKSFPIPNWILSDKNLQKIIEGNYFEILPLTAEFVTTLNCNFRCIQCSYSEPKKANQIWLDENITTKNKLLYKFHDKELHMTAETMRVLLDRLIDGGVENILFTGGGEPLMNKPVTLQGMKYAKNNNLNVGLYTNGSLLNKSTTAEILDISPLFVRVSIYGSDEKSFASYTRQTQSVYETVLENIYIFTMMKLESKSLTNFGLSYLVHPYTIKDISGIAKRLLTKLSLSQLNQIDFIRFTPAVDYFGGQQHPQEMMEDIFRYIESEVKPMFDGTNIKVISYFHRLSDLNQKKPYEHCRASGWFIEVGPSGDVFLCCEKLFNPRYKIGNLVDSSLMDIYAGRLRESVINGVNKSFCIDCPTLCKPHELNKVFDEVESYRNKFGSFGLSKWCKDVLRYGSTDPFVPGKLNNYES